MLEPVGPQLVGERVALRPVDVATAHRLLRRAPDAVESWAAGFPGEGTLVLAQGTVTAAAAGHPLGPFGAYLVVRRADALVVGDVGFHGPPRADGTVEVGFALVPEARGAGLATEALRLLVGWAVVQPVVRRVVARADPANTASRAVLARAGFVPDGSAGELLRYRLA